MCSEDYYDEEGAWLGSVLGQGAPLAPLHRLEAARGYNSLDVRIYREYLHFLAGQDVRSGPSTAPSRTPW